MINTDEQFRVSTFITTKNFSNEKNQCKSDEQKQIVIFINMIKFDKQKRYFKVY